MQVSLNPSRVFFGWWIVAACFIMSVYGAGVVVFGFTTFYDPIIKEFGWSYAQVSLGASLRGAETGLLAPLLGFFIDRWGARWILFAGALITGLGLMFLSSIGSYGGFFLGFIIISLGTSCTGPSVVVPAASYWFRKRLGLAMGILATGFGLGGFVLPLLVKLIDVFEWRKALFILGIASLVICLPLTFLIRRKPEDYGYGPEGAPLLKSAAVESDSGTQEVPVQEAGFTTRQALKSRAFWQITLAFTLQYAVVAAILAHVMPFLDSVGINRSTAGFIAAAIPVVSIGGRLGSGWLSDKMSRKLVTVFSFAVVLVGVFLFDYINNAAVWLLVLALVLYSLSYGSSNTLRAVLSREYFGRARYATIFGFMLGIMAVGTIIGPWVAGWIFDRWHSYHYAWWLFTGLNAVALVLLITTPRLKKA